ncbi:MAG: DUF72 domain-containing protein, partial [Anaerolineae bacterium]
MILIGTSGFSYKDWVGPYYPAGLPQREWLRFYAREFPTCELNFTYYRLPAPRTLERMADKVPPGFLFTLKAYQGITHEREDNEGAFIQFVESLKPLIEAGKFGGVLAQFPFSFHATGENRDYLRLCRERLGDLPVAVEFRNARWLTAETFALLRENKLGFCCVDEPRLKGLIPPVAEVTADVAYVRLHGRNAAKWWQHEHAWERYDYTYSDEELSEWVPKIRELAERTKTTFVFANNHWRGQAVDTAR